MIAPLISFYAALQSVIACVAVAAVILWTVVAALYLSVVLLSLVLRLSARLLAFAKMPNASRSWDRAANLLDDGSVLATWAKSLGSTSSPATRTVRRPPQR